MKTWNLNDLYLGFDETYQNDVAKLAKLVKKQIKHLKTPGQDDVTYIETTLKNDEQLTKLIRSLYSYASLMSSTDVTNLEAQTYQAKLQDILRELTVYEVKYSRYLTQVNLKALAKKSPLIKQYIGSLQKEQQQAKYLLSEEEELLYSKLSVYASSSWGQLQGLATANLMIKIDDQEYTFSDVRNLAYDASSEVRKKAYQAELQAYGAIDDFIALALSNIKREVNTVNELRGYHSALEKTLIQSNMKKATLDAMINAMMESRKYFEKYLQAKAKYLKHQNNLPFYDLFAPVGQLEKTYTYEEACELIVAAFNSYSPKLGAFAQKAFDQNWIDVYPKKGKRGGAFCSNQPQIKQSRILTNFTGSLSDVLTLAHELGHGYHGDIISNNAPLHWSYPMPLAETASIFCETIVNEYLLKQFTSKTERLSILENQLQSDTQVIIDILSRYLFETKVLDQATKPISKHQMKQWMIDAQKEAYLNGLDHDQLHPYMWLVKGHYYSAGLNFYNFPYAFGLLFGKGLYAQYLKNPQQFINAYDDLLALTTKADCEEVAMSMKIDITQPDFWVNSLSLVKKDIEEVIELLKI